MKKCKFCEHHACNKRDEEVCVKHLVYVGDDVEAGPLATTSLSTPAWYQE